MTFKEFCQATFIIVFLVGQVSGEDTLTETIKLLKLS